MSTAIFPSKNPVTVHPVVQEQPFANEISALYGAIPNGITRVLCPSDRDSRAISAPVFPRSARAYQRTYDLNAAGSQWNWRPSTHSLRACRPNR